MTETQAPYLVTRPVTVDVVFVEVERIRELLRPIEEATRANDADALRLSGEAQHWLDIMRLHADEAVTAYQRRDWKSIREHLKAVGDAWTIIREYLLSLNNDTITAQIERMETHS